MDDEPRWRRARAGAPLVVAYALLVANAVTAGGSLVTGHPWDWGQYWWLFFLMGLCAVMSIAVQALARRGVLLSTPEAQRRYEAVDETTRALRTGVLPRDADPKTWRARIRSRLTTAAGIVAFVGALGVTAAVLTAVTARRDHDDPVKWVLAVVSLLAFVPFVWLLIRIRRRATQLFAALN